MSNQAPARPKYALLEHSSQRTCDISASVSVGREDTDLVFPALVSLSRKHFRIVIDEEGAWIEDLGSSNGTKLNHIKLLANSKQALRNGDSIIAGKAVFTFQARSSIKKRVEDSQIEIGRPDSNPIPPHQSARLSPEISLMRQKPQRRDDGPDFVFSSTSSAQQVKKSKVKRVSSVMQYWTTALMFVCLSILASTELREIWAAKQGAPHSVQDMTLRYVFSMGLMYLVMVLVQFALNATIAKRWFFAVPSVLLSLFFGSVVGDKLDGFAEYRKADAENRLAATRSYPGNGQEKRAGSSSQRIPASKK